MKALARLFGHFASYHSHDRPILQWAGSIGFLAFPLFYLLRFTKETPPFNDIGLRLVAMALCLGLATRAWWPRRLQPYYLPYAYLALAYSMPFFFVFTALVNGGGTIGVANTFMAVFFLVLLTDWRNCMVILTAGAAAAVALFYQVVPDPVLPRDYVGRLPILVLVVIGGSAFKAAQKQVEAGMLKRTYTALAGSIAHEMRNPLLQLRHSLDGIVQALPAAVPGRAQELSASAAGELLRHVAEGELAVSRGMQVIDMTLGEVTARPLPTSQFAILSAAEVVGKAVREFGYTTGAERERIKVVVSQDFHFRADETAFLYVLFNLMKNALYYAAARPDLMVTIAVESDRIAVRDNGPGIPAAVVDVIFEPFRSRGKSGGTGLGLAYCRRVVQAFGGSIACDSREGQGACFTLTFPRLGATELREHEEAEADRARQALARHPILVVDDDWLARTTTRQKLMALGLEVDEAAGGEEALARLRTGRYRFLVLDLEMPGLDGFSVARLARQQPGAAPGSLCILAHSSESAPVASIRARQCGMDGFLAKPATALQLAQALARLAREHGPAAPDLAGTCVLVADDNAWNRRAIVAYLGKLGVETVEAGHGAEALAQLRGQRRWLAALVDLHMPIMDGLQVAQRLRAEGSQVPVLAMTARVDAGASEAAAEAGMVQFLTKPVDLHRLASLLQQMAAEQRGGRPAAAPASASRTAAAEASGRDGGAVPLLNVSRVDSYERLGLLEELLQEGVTEVGRGIGRLEQAYRQQDRAAARDLLHSLLGNSGEIGAQAVYHHVRGVYVPLLEEGRWSLDEAWMARLHELWEATARALAERAAAAPPSGAP
ncbi:MAG TPA: response regulator [Ramlibacter sp.]|nr:response regulator [Ramlibacter sp.]